MSNLREQKPVLSCTLPVKNPSLPPGGFGKRQGYARVPCHACGVQYRREIEEYSHPFAIHVSRFVCPERAPERSAARLGAGAA
jgi:hypothetical protein